MNVIDEIREVIEVRIDEDALSDKLFDKAVDPLMLKLLDLIPTEIDNAYYADKKEDLRVEFKKLLSKGIDKLEEKTGVDLDGKDEAVS